MSVERTFAAMSRVTQRSVLSFMDRLGTALVGLK
jgi:hypothetical protein